MRKVTKSVRGVRGRSKPSWYNFWRFAPTKGVGNRNSGEFPFGHRILGPWGPQVYIYTHHVYIISLSASCLIYCIMIYIYTHIFSFHTLPAAGVDLRVISLPGHGSRTEDGGARAQRLGRCVLRQALTPRQHRGRSGSAVSARAPGLKVKSRILSNVTVNTC